MSSRQIRPFSVAWQRNMHKQGQMVKTDSVTGFPELVASSGLPDYDQAQAFIKDVLVYRDNSLFRANSDIPANTPFSEGSGVNQWTNVTAAEVDIEIYDPAKTYNTGNAIAFNGSIWRANTDNLTGPFAAGNWQQLTQPPGRVIMEAGLSDDIVLRASKAQEVIFDVDKTISGFEFKEGDRILIKRNLTGTIVEADFHYYPFTVNRTGNPPEVTDVIRTAIIGDDVGFFYVINPNEDITVGVNIPDKIAWTAGTSPAANATLASISLFKMDSGVTTQLEVNVGYSVDAGDNKIFQILGAEGLEEGDVLTLTYTV